MNLLFVPVLQLSEIRVLGVPFNDYINKNVSVIKPKQREQEIGLIPLKILKKEIPKVYNSLEENIKHNKKKTIYQLPF